MRYRIAPLTKTIGIVVLAFDETYFLQANAERSHQMGRVRERRAAQEPSAEICHFRSGLHSGYSPATRPGGSPPTSPSCPQGAAEKPTGLYRPHFRYDLKSGHFAELRSLTSWPAADLRAAKKLRSWPKWWMAQTFCESNTNRRCDGRRSELVQDVDQLSVRWRAPFAEGLDRVGFGQAVEPGEQANALTAGKLGLGRAPAEE